MEILKHKKLKYSIRKYVNSSYYGTCYRVGIYEFQTYKKLLQALKNGELSFYENKPKKKKEPIQPMEKISNVNYKDLLDVEEFDKFCDFLAWLKKHRENKPQETSNIIDGAEADENCDTTNPPKEQPKYKCLLCGRNKFTRKQPHKCNGQNRKRGLKWEKVK